MADMLNVDALRRLKAEHPDATVVTYVNTSAEVKAESDVCCTSANADEVVGSFREDADPLRPRQLSRRPRHAPLVGRPFSMILWPGFFHLPTQTTPRRSSDHLLRRMRRSPARSSSQPTRNADAGPTPSPTTSSPPPRPDAALHPREAPTPRPSSTSPPESASSTASAAGQPGQDLRAGHRARQSART